MKKNLLTLFLTLATIFSASAVDFQWGTATWNINDGRVYEDITDLNIEGIVLTYPNPANYTLTFFHMIAVSYDLYVDDATEPIHTSASAQMSTAVSFDYPWVEGHKYKIVTTGAALAQANIATYTTDTLSQNSDSYTISFTINGPELVKTIEVEGTMSLSIVDQEWQKTYSLIDTLAICQALGVNDMSDVETYGLNPNGSYNPNYIDPFDGWHDADEGFTVWSGNAGGGVYSLLGHNPYPAVYGIKLSQTQDSVFYYFYDYWRDYDPDEPSEVPGSGTGIKKRAPETNYQNIVWDWDNGDGTTTKYTRSYRAEEGKDYHASFAFLANRKYVLLNATLHFVSQEAYAEYIANQQSGDDSRYDLDGDGKFTISDITKLIEIYKAEQQK